MTSELAEAQQLQINQSSLIEGTTSSTIKTQQAAGVYYYSYTDNLDRVIATTVSTRNRAFHTRRHSAVDLFFRLAPEKRLEIRKKTAAQIKSFDAVFTILDWSLRGDITNAYDAAVDLLAECNAILVSALQYFYLEYSKSVNQIDLDAKLDVLINGIARANKISAEARLRAVIQLAGSKSRIVKAAIIDAASMLVNKRNRKTVKALLSWFSSSKEADSYIRQYAEDALTDLT